MKRLALRTAALTAVLSGGATAIFLGKQWVAEDHVQAQEVAVEASLAPSGDAAADASTPAQNRSASEPAARRDPFAGGRLLNELGDSDRFEAINDKLDEATAPPSRYANVAPQAPAEIEADAEAEEGPNPLRAVMAAGLVSEQAPLPDSEQEPAPATDPLGRYGAALEQAPPEHAPREAVPAPIGHEAAPLASPPEQNLIDSRLPGDAFVPGSTGSLTDQAPQRRIADDAQPLDEPRSFDRGASLQGASPVQATASPVPGDAALEGVQVPSLQLQKTAPAEIQVGKPATFQIAVRNTGQATAHDVTVTDQAPRGTRLIGTEPRAEALADGAVQWRLGSLAPGEERLLTLELMPTAEGEVGSVASVRFRAEAAVRTVATKPELLLEVAGPREVMIDAPLTINVKVSNPGSGEATGVVLYETVPASLEHPAGDELEFEIGSLKPNETREIALTLHARQAGPVANIISVRGDAQLHTEAEVAFEVIAPRLEVALQGPKLRYLEREATYQVSVANPGTAPAKEVELVSHLPQGMKFVSANNAGQYDQATHSVYWSLAELPEGGSGTVELVALPIEPGEQAIRIEGTAEQGLSDSQETAVMVEGIAALYFGVVDVADPIEIGGASSYEIRVVNQGTKSADRVQMVAQFPPGLRPTAADGPSRGTIEGNRVVFEPLARLAPKADTTYTIQFEGAAAGDQRVTVQVISADMQQPVTKEESTKVYADR